MEWFHNFSAFKYGIIHVYFPLQYINGWGFFIHDKSLCHISTSLCSFFTAKTNSSDCGIISTIRFWNCSDSAVFFY